jgi:hypothetical protein
MKTFIFILLCMLIFRVGHTQTDRNKDVLSFKGTTQTVKGYILSMDTMYVKIKTERGDVITYNLKDVEQIVERYSFYQEEVNKDVISFKNSTKTVKGIILSRSSTDIKIQTEQGEVVSYPLKDIAQVVQRYAFSKGNSAADIVPKSRRIAPQANSKNAISQTKSKDKQQKTGNLLSIGLSLGGTLPMGDFAEAFKFGGGGGITAKQFYKSLGFHLSAGTYYFIDKQTLSSVQNPDNLDNVDFDNPQMQGTSSEKLILQIVPITLGIDYHYKIGIFAPYVGVEGMIGNMSLKFAEEKESDTIKGYGLKAGILFGNRTKLMIEGKYNSFSAGEDTPTVGKNFTLCDYC